MPYGPPEQIKPKALGDYLEVMSKGTFQSGMSWAVVEAKWPGIRTAFKDFDIDACELSDYCRHMANQHDNDVDYHEAIRQWLVQRHEFEFAMGEVHAIIGLSFSHEDEFKKKLQILQGFPPVTDSTPADSKELPTMR